MSLNSASAERDKYTYLLQLAKDQIVALETNDLFAFDRIIAAKKTLIDSLRDVRTMLEIDPTLGTIAVQIQECDKTAQRLLYRKVGKIMREMAELQQFKKARRAYRRPARPAGTARAAGHYADTAQLMDRRS